MRSENFSGVAGLAYRLLASEGAMIYQPLCCTQCISPF
jgi:hypothetical protein